MEESENVKSRSELIIQLEDKNRQLEEQLRSQASQSEDQFRQLEEQLRSQASRSETRSSSSKSSFVLKPSNLKTKSNSSKSSFSLKSLNLKTKSSSSKNSFTLRSLNPQARSTNNRRGSAHLNLALAREKQLSQSMTNSFSWRSMRPLRVLHQAVLKGVKHQNDLSSQSVAPPSNELRETDPGRELLSKVFDESHYLKHVPSAITSWDYTVRTLSNCRLAAMAQSPPSL